MKEGNEEGKREKVEETREDERKGYGRGKKIMGGRK